MLFVLGVWFVRFKSEFFGAVITGVYLCFIGLLVFLKRDSLPEMRLNEIGDFMAGAFGPIAFFWLILGYLQQGRELKLSSDALQLQAQELKNSVEQQSIMASAALQQIESKKASLRLQEQERERSIAPQFRGGCGARSGDGVGNPISTGFHIFNDGAGVTDVSIIFEPSIGGVASRNLGSIPHAGTSATISLEFICPRENFYGKCLISYLRSDGRRATDELIYAIPSNNPFVFLERKPLAL
jgi:hypothetical protein